MSQHHDSYMLNSFMQNAAELKTHVDAHKQEIEELKNELAASRTQVLYNCYNYYDNEYVFVNL